MVWILFSPSWLGTSFDVKVSPRELPPYAPTSPSSKEECTQVRDDLCGRQRLVIHLKPNNWHALPLALARLIGNNGEMAKQGLGTLNTHQVGLTYLVIKGHIKKITCLSGQMN